MLISIIAGITTTTTTTIIIITAIAKVKFYNSK